MVNGADGINPNEIVTALKLYRQADTDGVKGLQGQEIEVFKNLAKEANVQEKTVNEILGLEISDTSDTNNSNSPKTNGPKNLYIPNDYFEAVDYFNNNGMTTEQRQNIANNTLDRGLITLQIYMKNFESLKEIDYFKNHPELFDEELVSIIREISEQMNTQSVNNGQVNSAELIDALNNVYELINNYQNKNNEQVMR